MATESDAPLVVLCTAPDEEVAARLARGLVETRLAACVNVIPGLRSFYTWKGEVQDDREVQLFIKTRRGRLAEVERWITEHHPYEVPEIVALAVADGSKPYLDWLRAESN